MMVGWLVLAFVLGVVCALVGVWAARHLHGRPADPVRSTPDATAEVSARRSLSLLDDLGTSQIVQPEPSGRTSSPIDGAAPGDPISGATVRAAILRAAAERMPGGSTILIVCPPRHRLPAAWHVHLSPIVTVALEDGRQITVAPPEPSIGWRLVNGRVVDVAEGEPDRSPHASEDTVHVVGWYVQITLQVGTGARHELVASVYGDQRGPTALEADAGSASAVESALRRAIDLAAGGGSGEESPLLSYSRTAWQDHERIWFRARET